MKGSESENHGLSALTDTDLAVYSVGVSTGGVAEIRMAQSNPARCIVATTIDQKGSTEAQAFILKQGLSSQIEVKIEDVSKSLEYRDGFFDFIYARLVLHYLSKQQLPHTLAELKRILKPGGKLYVVVRSDKCPDAIKPGAEYDSATGLTAYPAPVKLEGVPLIQRRFFHTEDSIANFVKDSGFKIAYAKSYDEQLYADFMRTKPAPHYDNVIELLAVNE